MFKINFQAKESRTKIQSSTESSRGGPELRTKTECYLKPDAYSVTSTVCGYDICMFFCNNESVVQVEKDTATKVI